MQRIEYAALQRRALLTFERAAFVERGAAGIDHAPEQFTADRHLLHPVGRAAARMIRGADLRLRVEHVTWHHLCAGQQPLRLARSHQVDAIGGKSDDFGIDGVTAGQRHQTLATDRTFNTRSLHY